MPSILIADSFFPSVANLQSNEQARVNRFLLDFYRNPAQPGISLERLRQRKGNSLWSGRITQELRAILSKDGDSWMLLHAGHHDAAYAWAGRRQAKRHSKTNAVQIIQTVEVTREAVSIADPPLFLDHSDDYLISLGLPEDWLPVIREVRNEDVLLDVCTKLPQEVGERLLDVASGKLVTPPPPPPRHAPIMAHPDAGRRFFLVKDADALEHMLEGKLEDWMLFLHPDQRRIVEGVYSGAVQVMGAAGTGKTVVALHRARELARRDARVLLATYTRNLAQNLSRSLDRLCIPRERKRLLASTLHSQALKLAQKIRPALKPVEEQELTKRLRALNDTMSSGFGDDVLLSEWRGVVQPSGLLSWAQYREASRVGRGKPLTIQQRHGIWSVFAALRRELDAADSLDWSALCEVAAKALEDGRLESPFQGVIVDELQDLGAAELRFIRALTRDCRENLMLVGDAGQRIFGRYTDTTGVNVAGRVFRLRLNYRTTEQIRNAAEDLLGDEETERSRSLLKGPPPLLKGFEDQDAESAAVLQQIQAWQTSGLDLAEIGILGRSQKRQLTLRAQLQTAELSTQQLSQEESGALRIGTLHGAKGLEFKAVVVLGCEEGTLPHGYVLRLHPDPRDQEDVLERERHLLYVGMTRARDELMLTWVGSPSRFLPTQS